MYCAIKFRQDLQVQTWGVDAHPLKDNASTLCAHLKRCRPGVEFLFYEFEQPARRETLIARAIRCAIADLGLAPAEINNGNCDALAEKVRLALGAEVRESDLDAGEPGHLFILWRGRFYDAECLTGVADYHDLPIFNRKQGPPAGCLQKGQAYERFLCSIRVRVL